MPFKRVNSNSYNYNSNPQPRRVQNYTSNGKKHTSHFLSSMVSGQGCKQPSMKGSQLQDDVRSDFTFVLSNPTELMNQKDMPCQTCGQKGGNTSMPPFSCESSDMKHNLGCGGVKQSKLGDISVASPIYSDDYPKATGPFLGMNNSRFSNVQHRLSYGGNHNISEEIKEVEHEHEEEDDRHEDQPTNSVQHLFGQNEMYEEEPSGMDFQRARTPESQAIMSGEVSMVYDNLEQEAISVIHTYFSHSIERIVQAMQSDECNNVKSLTPILLQELNRLRSFVSKFVTSN